ncbi:uncharacterized protein LOC108193766 isoform X3 [Daucus carota subsp. sativus]|uniref:uncharacterized protein LOC108193766 isoform X3 n=1 Tax=Daucus carota subsp. sativus TaxID=79200 RepID=UPI0007EFEAEA|nr:PREDICTED: uncharacterized protein LOC108193766 isoform X2 [Daucus carota subsp. sativus]
MGKIKVIKTHVSLFLILLFQASIPVFSISEPSNQAQEEDAASRVHRHNEENADEVHCSRKRSRAAWKITEEYLMPFVEREKYQLSQHCRLHPDNDIFRDQEQNKIHVDINEWRCGYCRKSFRSEKYLDQHLGNRHSNLLNTGLADKCFPVNHGPSAHRLHEIFLRQFCDAHTCSGGHKPFSRGGKKHTSIFYLAISILTLMLVPLFYVIVYLYQREMRKDSQAFKRISRRGQKPKPS